MYAALVRRGPKRVHGFMCVLKVEPFDESRRQPAPRSSDLRCVHFPGDGDL